MPLLDNLTIPLLESVGGASVRALILAGIAALTLRALRITSAPLQHAVWTIVVVAMLALPFATSLLPAIPFPVSVPNWYRPPATTPPRTPVPASEDRILRAEPIVIQIDSSGLTTNSAAQSRLLVGWPSLLAAVYLTGVAAFLARIGLGLFIGARLLARGTTLRNTHANTLLAAAAADHQIPFPWPKICESPEISAPVVLGGQDSTIVLPVAWREWDEWKLQAVLSHELMHTRRGDGLVVVLAALNRALFWFHPLAWWLERKLSTLCEQASDDAVVRMTGDPARYAQVVLEIAANAGPHRFRLPPAALAAPSMAGARNTGRRIHRLLDDAQQWSSGILTKGSWLVLTFCAVPVVALLAAAQSPQPAPTVQGDVPANWNWTETGFKTTADGAQSLERRLAQQPEDLSARANVMAYYLYNANLEALERHVDWLIEHHPETEIARVMGNVGWPMRPKPGSDTPQGLKARKDLWLRQVAKHPNDPRVVGHAGGSIVDFDAVEAERLLLKARELDPANDRWLHSLTGLYSQAIRTAIYQELGIAAFTTPGISSGFIARVQAQLDSSKDIKLVGSVGAAVSRIVAIRESRPGFDAQFMEARRRLASQARTLLQQAVKAEPENVMWSRVLEDMEQRLAREAAQALLPPALAPQKGTPVPPDQQARLLLSSTPPIYPPLAQMARIQGVVRCKVVIGIDGRPAKVTLMTGHPLLVPGAIESIRTYVYQPPLAPVETTVDVNFTLPQ